MIWQERFARIFCVRMRRVFAAILDVLQENATKSGGKNSAKRRRHNCAVLPKQQHAEKAAWRGTPCRLRVWAQLHLHGRSGGFVKNLRRRMAGLVCFAPCVEGCTVIKYSYRGQICPHRKFWSEENGL